MKRWTTGEVSKQRNISVRTLRYYDQINLLTPSFKDDKGKRLYSEDDLFKLEKIIILKSLSLSLKDIHHVLEKLSYKQVLTSHYNHLQEQLLELQTSISQTTSLLNMIDLNESLSWESVSKIVDQSKKHNPKKWMDYFQEEEKIFLQKMIPNISKNDEITQHYMSLLHRIEWCIEQNIEPESEEGLQIASKLIGLSNENFQGDTELMEKFWEIRKLPTEETGFFPISEEVMEFIERSITYLEI